MLNTSIRVTGDTSSLQTAFDQAGVSVDRFNDKVNGVKDNISNIPNPNFSGVMGGDGGYNTAAIQNATTAAVTQQGQVIQQIVHNSNGGSGVANNVTAAVSNMFQGEGKSGLLGTLAKAGALGTGLAAIIGGLSLGNKTVQQWEKQIPNITGSFSKLTSGLGGNSAAENSDLMREMFDKVNNQRFFDYTMFKNEDYMSVMSDLSQYGYKDYYSSLQDASELLKFENAGMGSRSQLAAMQGMAQRFGLENALNSAYAGLEMSGMQKGQFDEFLSSMEDILESGIAKGFVKGADEIATDLTMLETLSGGSKLWQGQYGAENLSKMNSALENATSLSGVNDVLLYRAMSGLDKAARETILGESYTGDSYIDTQMILERGINKYNIGAIFDIVNAEGGTERDKIARYKNMFGVSYSKALDIYNMSTRYDPNMAETIASTIQGYTADTGFESKEQQLLSSYETAAAEVQKMGQAALGAKRALTSIVNLFAGVEENEIVLDSEYMPFSDKELSIMDELIENYEGPMNKNDIKNKLRDYFYDSNSSVWADATDFQNMPGLKDAWNSRNGTEFFNALFGEDSEYVSTPFGPMTIQDFNTLYSKKSTPGFKKMASSMEKLSREELEELQGQYLAVTGRTNMSGDGILATLQEIASLIRDGRLVLKGYNGH